MFTDSSNNFHLNIIIMPHSSNICEYVYICRVYNEILQSESLYNVVAIYIRRQVYSDT